MTDALCTIEEEAHRLARLAELAILDTAPESEFDAIVELARRLFAVPIATVSLIDDRRMWMKARSGIEATEVPREQSFCAHAIYRPDMTVVEDALADPRFADNPFVTGEPFIRFYAGVPLRPEMAGGAVPAHAVGTLCIVDGEPRAFPDSDRAQLRAMAIVVEALIRARTSVTAAVRLSHEVNEHAVTCDRVNRQLRQAERMARVGSWRLDLATNVCSWSDHVYDIHELPAGQQPPLAEALSFYPEPERSRVEQLVQRAAETGEPFDFESDFITAKGSIRRVHSMGEVELVDGKPAALIGVFQDITQRYRREQSLQEAARTDSLTGLPNRAMFDERLAQLATQRGARVAPYALLLVDLDGFKAVNDTLGHHAGDEVLRVMGAKLSGASFASAFVARLGGDEFVILIDRARDCASLPAFVQSLLRELRHTIGNGEAACTVTATVGAALSEDAAEAKQTLHQADLALYAAKRSERGTGRIFGDRDVIEVGSVLPRSKARRSPVRAVA